MFIFPAGGFIKCLRNGITVAPDYTAILPETHWSECRYQFKCHAHKVSSVFILSFLRKLHSIFSKSGTFILC
jgi:hypothetical protein